MFKYLRNLHIASHDKRTERGASAVEYGLLIAGIAALIVIVVFAFGDNINDIFEDTCNDIASGNSAASGC
jgi:pilus assembly protein Flp/PilA